MTSVKGFDQQPQFMKMRQVQSAAATFTQLEAETPVIPTISGNKAIVMEILKVYYWRTAITYPATSPLSDVQIQMQCGRESLAAIANSDSDDHVVPFYEEQFTNVEVGTTANNHTMNQHTNPKIIDVTDGQGNGIIYAGRKLYFGVDSGNLSAALTGSCWILFRLIKVDIKEFLGEVLS